jgi:hypothetical protein
MPSTRTWSRRKLLTSSASAAVLSPFWKLLANPALAGSPPPSRVVFVFGGICTVAESFYPKGPSETDWPITPILTPLRDFKSKLFIPMGLKSHYGGEGSHGGGTICYLTAANSDNWGMSIDQHIATALKGQTPVESLNLGVACGGFAASYSRVSWRSRTSPTPLEQTPANAYKSLFGAVATAAPKPPIDMGTPLAPRFSRAQFDKSLLDSVRSDISELAMKLGAEEALKLEVHLDSIRQMERLMADPMRAMPTETSVATNGGAARCTKPADAQGPAFKGNDNFPLVGRMQMDILVNALACDLSRVAVLQWTRGTNDIMFNWLADKNKGAVDPDYAWLTDTKILAGIGDFGHHIISHENGGDTRGMYGFINDCRPKLTAISTWYSAQIAYMAKKLQSIPEGNGTMLDNTLIVWGCEIESGTGHNPSPKPYVLVGNLGKAFRTGRAVNYRATGGSSRQLYTSITDALGIGRMAFEGTKDGPLNGFA